MPRQQKQETSEAPGRKEFFSEFEKLRLGQTEIDALRRQGFVSRELRGNLTIFKLRFRMDGRQRTKYLGTDPIQVREVEDELLRLRRRRELYKHLVRLDADRLDIVREGKKVIAPLLSEAGFHFHGNTIRRVRYAKIRTMQLTAFKKQDRSQNGIDDEDGGGTH